MKLKEKQNRAACRSSVSETAETLTATLCPPSISITQMSSYSLSYYNEYTCLSSCRWMSHRYRNHRAFYKQKSASVKNHEPIRNQNLCLVKVCSLVYSFLDAILSGEQRGRMCNPQVSDPNKKPQTLWDDLTGRHVSCGTDLGHEGGQEGFPYNRKKLLGKQPLCTKVRPVCVCVYERRGDRVRFFMVGGWWGIHLQGGRHPRFSETKEEENRQKKKRRTQGMLG